MVIWEQSVGVSTLFKKGKGQPQLHAPKSTLVDSGEGIC